MTEPGTKLVIAAEGVPVGDYTRQVLEDLDLTAALDNVVSNEDDVKGVLGKVALGEADAGFVYITDAAVSEEDVTVDRVTRGLTAADRVPDRSRVGQREPGSGPGFHRCGSRAGRAGGAGSGRLYPPVAHSPRQSCLSANVRLALLRIV